MLNFDFYNPTKIYFGKGSLGNLEKELENCGINILLVTGGSSIKHIGLYENVINTLKKASKNIYEVSGIKPNPRLSLVYEGIELCKKHNITFILAVGGGSVIDTAKAIAVGAKTDKDIWEFFLRKQVITDALPLGTVLTLSATGTEMNGNAVVTRWESNDKLAISSKLINPKFSILDPEYTYTVSREHTVNGSIDIMIHVFEQYFSKTPNTPLQDRISEGIIKTVIENTYVALKDPNNYDARANIMWCSTMALNGIIGSGKEQDWASHDIEHEVSAIYDIAHGTGLAIISPNWMKHVMKESVDKFKQYAVRVWDVNPTGKTNEEIALEGIHKTQGFFKEIGAPTTFREAGIDDKNIEVMAEKAVRFGPIGSYKKLYKADVEAILRLSL